MDSLEQKTKRSYEGSSSEKNEDEEDDGDDWEFEGQGFLMSSGHVLTWDPFRQNQTVKL